MVHMDTGTMLNGIEKDHIHDGTNLLSELRRRITLAKGQEKVDIVIENVNPITAK